MGYEGYLTLIKKEDFKNEVSICFYLALMA